MDNCNTFNFIQSVKGGCGKTTFSIYLSSFFARRTESGSEGLLIDMDLQGTSLQYLVIGGKLAEGKKCLQDAIKEPDDWIDCIEMIKILGNFDLPIIFSSIDPKVKKKFKINAEYGYVPIIQHSMVSGSMIDLLKKFRKSDHYNNFIFDMPPSSEGFSEIPLTCTLANKGGKIVHSKDMVNLFYLTTLDTAQIKTTIEHIYNFLDNLDTYVNYQVFIVFNNNYILPEKGGRISDIHGNAIGIFKEFLNSTKIYFTEENLSKMYLCQMSSNINYVEKIIKNDGLQTIDVDNDETADEIIPGLPINYIIDFNRLLQLDDIKNLDSIAVPMSGENFIKLLRGQTI